MASDPQTRPTESRQGWRFHRDVWTVEDRLRYSVYAKALAEFIKHRDTEAPFVIAVQGPWGQGKTSFMRMVQNCLDHDHPDLAEKGKPVEPEGTTARLTFRELLDILAGRLSTALQFKKLAFPTVWFNAWNHQNSEQLWAGLAHCIIQQLAGRLEKIEQRELFWLQLQLTRIEPAKIRKEMHGSIFEQLLPSLVTALILFPVFCALLFLGFKIGGGWLWVSGLPCVGTPIVLLLRWRKARSKALAEKLKGTYVQFVRHPEYRERMGSLPLVQEDVIRALDLLVAPNHPAVVFVDDLDRCSPSNVADVISAINLFLAGSSRHCIFVLGMDAEVVAAAMEVAHEKVIAKLPERNGELGWSYMDKFIQLPVVLPRVLDKDQRGYFEFLMNEKREPAPQPPEVFGAATEESSGIATLEDIKKILERYYSHLSFNPRTLIKVVNLFRLHIFLQEERRKAIREEPAQPEQVLAWVILLARWPFFVRWLQRLRRQVSRQQKPEGADASSREEIADRILEKVIERARMTDNPRAWADELKADGIEHDWAYAPGLFEFLKEDRELHLEQASTYGFW